MLSETYNQSSVLPSSLPKLLTLFSLPEVTRPWIMPWVKPSYVWEFWGQNSGSKDLWTVADTWESGGQDQASCPPFSVKPRWAPRHSTGGEAPGQLKLGILPQSTVGIVKACLVLYWWMLLTSMVIGFNALP